MTKKLTHVCFVLCLLMLNLYGAAQTGAAPKEEEEFAAKKSETKLTEIVSTDSLPASELLKRAVNWIKKENPDYKKSSGATTSSKAECTASFPVKPKELNPEVDYTGKITMKVVIECKDSRYRYTISDIRHQSKSGRTSAGSIDNKVPECGSMVMTDLVWKKLKGQALHNAATIVSDLKDGMSAGIVEVNQEEW